MGKANAFAIADNISNCGYADLSFLGDVLPGILGILFNALYQIALNVAEDGEDRAIVGSLKVQEACPVVVGLI
jgi:hypothetical protein